MPRPRHASRQDAAEALSLVAPLTSRWVERLLAAHDPPLSLAQYVALVSIGNGGLVEAELAKQAAVSPAAVSQLLAGLEREGLLARAPSSGDRRRQTLALGPHGKTVLRSARTMLRGQLAQLVDGLPPHEVDALAALLGHVQARLTGTAPPARPPRHQHPPPPPPHRRHR